MSGDRLPQASFMQVRSLPGRAAAGVPVPFTPDLIRRWIRWMALLWRILQPTWLKAGRWRRLARCTEQLVAL